MVFQYFLENLIIVAALLFKERLISESNKFAENEVYHQEWMRHTLECKICY